jgi:hypothetical protein
MNNIVEIIRGWKGLEKVFGWIGAITIAIAWLLGIGFSIYFIWTA